MCSTTGTLFLSRRPPPDGGTFTCTVLFVVMYGFSACVAVQCAWLFKHLIAADAMWEVTHVFSSVESLISPSRVFLSCLPPVC